jgi:hypothetical protein
MLERFRKIREPYRAILIGLITLVVMVTSKMWPSYSYAIWGAFIAFMAVVLYEELAEPVNYFSIHISPGVIEYDAIGRKHHFRLDEISRVEFVREEADYDTGNETKWMIYTGDGHGTEVMDEWPDRRKLLRAFEEHLPGFDMKTTRKGLRAWGKGRWLCYTAPKKP